MARKKFKKYFTGEANRTGKVGKGSDRRPMDISEEEFVDNWDRTFRKNREHADPFDEDFFRDFPRPINAPCDFLD